MASLGNPDRCAASPYSYSLISAGQMQLSAGRIVSIGGAYGDMDNSVPPEYPSTLGPVPACAASLLRVMRVLCPCATYYYVLPPIVGSLGCTLREHDAPCQSTIATQPLVRTPANPIHS